MKFNFKNLVVILLVFIATGFFVHQKIRPETIKLHMGDIEYTMEVADTKLERQKGLSNRKHLNTGSGMLFIFEKPDKYSFWMKDMNFPIDIVWVDENKTIVEITKNLQPNSYPKTFGPNSPILYAIEINALESEKNNIKIGQILKL